MANEIKRVEVARFLQGHMQGLGNSSAAIYNVVTKITQRGKATIWEARFGVCDFLGNQDGVAFQQYPDVDGAIKACMKTGGRSPHAWA